MSHNTNGRVPAVESINRLFGGDPRPGNPAPAKVIVVPPAAPPRQPPPPGPAPQPVRLMPLEVDIRDQRGLREETLKLDECGIDSSYQREPKKKWRKIVRDYNPIAFLKVLVGRRRDGSQWVVDGQQRGLAARAMGWTHWPCLVFDSDGPDHEARVFAAVNGDRAGVTAAQNFNARLVGGVKSAVEINAAAVAEGFRIVAVKGGRTGDENNALVCVATLNRLYELCGDSAEGIQFALRMIHTIWPGNNDALSRWVVGGLGIFWRDMKDRQVVVNENHLARHLANYRYGVTTLLNAAKADTERTMEYAVAHILFLKYPKRSPRKRI